MYSDTLINSAYANNDTWYDTITNLAQAHLENQQDSKINQDWIELLKSVSLDEIVGVSIVKNYSLEQQESSN